MFQSILLMTAKKFNYGDIFSLTPKIAIADALQYFVKLTGRE
ncbi:MAG: hypothetical protein VKL41_03085 [Snowella sp.]|nr:hypothetical protein [Snowella sp.]